MESHRQLDYNPLALAINRLASAIGELAAALGPETQRMSPAAQAALDLVLRDSRRVTKRLVALDAQTPPAPAAPSTQTT